MILVSQASHELPAGVRGAWVGAGLRRAATVSILAAGLLAAGDTTPTLAQVPQLPPEVKDFIDAAGEVAEQIDQLDPAKKTATLTKIGDGLGKLAALGPALGLLGAGLDLILFIARDPSEADPVLSAIQGVSEQIDHLDDRIVALFADLEDENTKLLVETVLTERFSGIESRYRTWDTRQRTMNADIDHTLTMNNLAVLYEQASLIADYCTGSNNAVPLFSIIEKTSYGDLEAITGAAAIAMTRLAQAELVDAHVFRSVVQKDELKKASAQLSEAEKADLQKRAQTQARQKYEPLLQRCHDAFQAAKASALTNRAEHVVAYVRKEPAALGRKAATAKEIGEALQRKHPDKDWIVAVYKPVWGFDNHLVMWRGGTATGDKLFRLKIGEHNEEKNLVVHWYDPMDTHTAVQSGKYAALIASSSRYLFFCERDGCSLRCGDAACSAAKEQGYRGRVKTSQVGAPFQSGPVYQFDLDYDRYDIREKIKGIDPDPPPFRLFGRISATGYPDIYLSNSMTAWYTPLPSDLWSIVAY